MALGHFMEALMDFSVSIKLQKAALKKLRESATYNSTNVNDKKKEGSPLEHYYRNAGQANFELGQFNEALQHFEKAFREDPSGHNYLNRGMAYMKLCLYEDAAADFGKALAKYVIMNDNDKPPHNQYKVHYNMGINFRNMGQYQESVTNFRKCIEMSERPELSRVNKSSAYNNCGLSNFEWENYDQAVKDFENAIKKNKEKSIGPDNKVKSHEVSAHYNNLGLAQTYLGDIDGQYGALYSFGKAIQLEPHDPNCFYNRGNVYLNQNSFALARIDFDSAIRIQSTNPKFYHAKGLAYEAEAIHLEAKMLANPTEARLDAQGYPVDEESDELVIGDSGVEETKSPMMPNSEDQNKMVASAPNQEIGRVKLKIYPILQRAIKCYFEAMNQDESFLESRFHAALML